jgi:hypothetical protein
MLTAYCIRGSITEDIPLFVNNGEQLLPAGRAVHPIKINE